MRNLSISKPEESAPTHSPHASYLRQPPPNRYWNELVLGGRRQATGVRSVDAERSVDTREEGVK